MVKAAIAQVAIDDLEGAQQVRNITLGDKTISNCAESLGITGGPPGTRTLEEPFRLLESLSF